MWSWTELKTSKVKLKLSLSNWSGEERIIPTKMAALDLACVTAAERTVHSSMLLTSP